MRVYPRGTVVYEREKAYNGINLISTAKDGALITKMDGTAKGGIAVTIADEYDMPIKFLGIGEKKEDLEPFNAKAFAEEVFDE